MGYYVLVLLSLSLIFWGAVAFSVYSNKEDKDSENAKAYVVAVFTVVAIAHAVAIVFQCIIIYL